MNLCISVPHSFEHYGYAASSSALLYIKITIGPVHSKVFLIIIEDEWRYRLPILLYILNKWIFFIPEKRALIALLLP